MSKEPTRTTNEELAARLADTESLIRGIQKAVREAVLEHKRAGNPVATVRDGQVVLVQPEDIEIPEEPAGEKDEERFAA